MVRTPECPHADRESVTQHTRIATCISFSDSLETGGIHGLPKSTHCARDVHVLLLEVDEMPPSMPRLSMKTTHPSVFHHDVITQAESSRVSASFIISLLHSAQFFTNRRPRARRRQRRQQRRLPYNKSPSCAPRQAAAVFPVRVLVFTSTYPTTAFSIFRRQGHSVACATTQLEARLLRFVIFEFPSEAMNDLVTFKLLAALTIFFLAIAGGLFPLVVHRVVDRHLTSVLNMAAAGIFLSASMVHMLPDAVRNAPLRSLGGGDDDDSFFVFPYAFLFYGVGFLAILVLETAAHALQHAVKSKVARDNERRPLIVNTPQTLDSADECVAVEVAHAHMDGLIDSDANPVVAFVVFAALSFHSLVEGVGIGAASTDAWNILLAIVAHKSLAAMALCLELLNHHVGRMRIATSLVIFAAMSPVGVLLGALLVGDDPSESAAAGICTALAGGTFLYVGAMEIIPQELHDRRHLTSKCAALLATFAAFSLLALWV
ncbi:Aste57867_13744 [Aphanomyces stellatus]|uniref:Aste57867_13744 protein n=1 Tax=Aphanomyces stellatus TaxID=120398 RepID=A0A485KZU0_9STRA|nr:hypothetical protein As57867_013694 [Aphanomyces stellatus]VFT90577.1 Aste57867_13744 [Aphanomyces stellatus]